MARSSAGWSSEAFESLVGDVMALRCDLVAGLIGPRDFIEGLRLLLPRLERFAPGGPASAVAQRCEQVVLNALTQGESADETPDRAATRRMGGEQ